MVFVFVQSLDKFIKAFLFHELPSLPKLNLDTLLRQKRSEIKFGHAFASNARQNRIWKCSEIELLRQKEIRNRWFCVKNVPKLNFNTLFQQKRFEIEFEKTIVPKPL